MKKPILVLTILFMFLNFENCKKNKEEDSLSFGLKMIVLGTVFAPVKPVVTAVAGKNQVTISWPADEKASKYNLYWTDRNSVNKPTTIENVTSPYVHSGLTDGEEYKYTLEAIGSASVKSEEVSVSLLHVAPTLKTTPGKDNISISASQTYLSGTTFNIYWNTTGSPTTSSTKITTQSLPYTHSGISNRNQYYYILTAVNSAGESPVSNVVMSSPIYELSSFSIGSMGPGYGAVFDSSGNMYVAGKDNRVIYKISSSGTVTTFAGSGNSAFVDGTGTAASFYTPRGIAIDKSGNLFVADSYKIRKITPAGVVTTYAGSGLAGSDDGEGTTAKFNVITGIAINSSGDVFVTDQNNHTIRKITTNTSGVQFVSTFAGSAGSSGAVNGTGLNAKFNLPVSIAIDKADNIFIVDSGNHQIRKITSKQEVTTLAGSGSAGYADGSGTAASFSSPNGIAVDSSGNLYVTDSGNYWVRKITPLGLVYSIGRDLKYSKVYGICLDSSAKVYILYTSINSGAIYTLN